MLVGEAIKINITKMTLEDKTEDYFLKEKMCDEKYYPVRHCDLIYTKYCPMTCDYVKKKVMLVRIKKEEK